MAPMAPARMQHLGGNPSPEAVCDEGDASGPRVRDDMTVEVALSLMAGARVDHLVLCDEDDQSTGRMSLARLAVLRGSPAYTDRIRLRDVLDGTFALSGARPEAVGEPRPRRCVSTPRSGHIGTTGGTASREM